MDINLTYHQLDKVKIFFPRLTDSWRKILLKQDERISKTLLRLSHVDFKDMKIFLGNLIFSF